MISAELARIKLSPSLMCMDLCNLEQSVREITQFKIDMLHIDVIDGHFSPSMPLGIDTVRKLREKTEFPFDVHLMTKNNDFFIDEFIDIGVQQLCFHFETELHVDRHLSRIKKSGVRSGIALTPATPISVLEYALENCDFIMLMLINPGYALHDTEKQVSYALRKVSECKAFIDRKGLEISIEVDGRISIANIPGLVSAGADILVLGSTSLFSGNRTVQENLEDVFSSVDIGLKQRISK